MTAPRAMNSERTRGDVAAWQAVLLQQPTACSTLDLLKRVTNEHLPEPAAGVPGVVRNEMLGLAHTSQQQQSLKRAQMNHRKPVANMATLGELLNRPKQRLVPGTPVTRKLKASKMVRTDERDSLTTCRSAPALQSPHNASITASSTPPSADISDALDQALQDSQSTHLPTKHYIIRSDDPATTQLKEQRQQLEQELLHVTQKLCRKYTKELFPVAHVSLDKTRERADKWSHSDTLSESELSRMYMDSRFTTQKQLDFYARDLEPREPASNRHKRDTAHTKYGDALVRNKHSLRANF